MRRTILGWTALVAALAIGAPAASQPGDRPGATFFVKNSYKGRSVFVDRPIRSFSELDMQGKISSITIQSGRWLVCEHDDFQGRCQLIDHNIDYLGNMGMDDMISSARPLDDRGGGPGPGSGAARPGPDGGRPGYTGGAYAGAGYGGELPGGPWQQSCRGGRVEDWTLIARCDAGHGEVRTARARVRECPSGRFYNRNGDLVCE